MKVDVYAASHSCLIGFVCSTDTTCRLSPARNNAYNIIHILIFSHLQIFFFQIIQSAENITPHSLWLMEYDVTRAHIPLTTPRIQSEHQPSNESNNLLLTNFMWRLILSSFPSLPLHIPSNYIFFHTRFWKSLSVAEAQRLFYIFCYYYFYLYFLF